MLETSANTALAADERWQVVLRVCDSRYLVHSQKLREFLLFIGERSLTGQGTTITETEIARRVFARGENFVPAEDSIVRGAARQLRIKLKEYFDGDGAAEPWRIEIPKGSYLPVFSKTAQAVVPVLPPASHPWLKISLAANAILLMVCAGLCIWGPVRQPSPPKNAVTEMLHFTSGGISLVYSDFSLAGMRALTPHKPDRFHVDDYARWDYSSLKPGPSADAGTLSAFDLFRTHRLTRTGDLSLVAQIVRVDASTHRIVPRDARDVTARDFRSGSHILLGNPNSTPWTELFESRLGLRWVHGAGYRDEKAARGAPATYFTTASTYDETGPGYARLALLPNLADENQVLMIGGVNMVTMEAAGDFALDPHHWEEIRQALKALPNQPTPYFEALLQTKAVDNTPQTARLIFARRVQ